MILIILFVLIVSLISLAVSFAYWKFTGTQEEFNYASSKCFQVDLLNESDAITLYNQVPTKDEDGLKGKGYTFTIKNVCNTSATYQVNLEDLLFQGKKLSNEYIKVSLNESTPLVLNHYTKVTPTLENAEESFQLTSGSLKPKEEITYELKLWMDEDTPAKEEVMEATFESKITIIATYIEDEKLKNEIEMFATSQNNDYSNKSEKLQIQANSENYSIIAFSEDGKSWMPIAPVKEFQTIQEYYEDGIYKFYVKDEIGTVKEIEFETKYLDKRAPDIQIGEIREAEKVILNITIFDEKSGVEGYQITTSKEVPVEWNSYEGDLREEITERNIYYIWAKDKVGNISYEAYSVEEIDNKAPEVTLTSDLSSWGVEDTIHIHAKDDFVGLSGYYVSKEDVEEIPAWILIENTLEKTIDYSIQENGIYYVYVKDAFEHITKKEITISYIDDIPLLSEITSTSDGNWEEEVTLSWNIEENGSGIEKVQISYDLKEWQDLEKNLWSGMTIHENGEKTLYLRVIDMSGNISNISSTSFKISTDSPQAKWEVEESVNGSNGWYQNVTLKANITPTFSGIQSAKYCITTLSSCTPHMTPNLYNDTFQISFEGKNSTQRVCMEIKDNADKTSGVVCSSSYKVDSQNPRPSISASISGKTIHVDASGSSDLESGIDKYYYSKDGGTTWVEQTTNTYNFTNLDIGTYVIALKVKDKSGRESEEVSQILTIAINANNYVKSKSSSAELVYDGTTDNNLRYIGESPNNYVLLNDHPAYQPGNLSQSFSSYGECHAYLLKYCDGNTICVNSLPCHTTELSSKLWRIIGVMNQVDNGSGKKETRLKLVKSTSLGTYTLDTTSSKSARGSGISLKNSYLANILNTTYYNKGSGTCYGYNSSSKTYAALKPCDFSSSGFPSESKAFIGNAIRVAHKREFKDSTFAEIYASVESQYTAMVSLADTSDSAFQKEKSTAAWLQGQESGLCSPVLKANGTKMLLSCSSGSFIACNEDSEIFPSVFLNSTIAFKGGNGTKSNPYIVHLNETTTIPLDTTAPVISNLTSSSGGNFTNSSVQLSWNIDETGSGIDKVQYSTDNSIWIDLPESSWYKTTIEGDKNSTYFIRALDKAGNISNVVNVPVKIDQVGPEVILNSSSEKWTKSLTLTVHARDVGSGLAEAPYEWNGISPFVSSNSYQVASNGTYTVKVRDKVGNITSKSMVISNIDSIPPSVNFRISSSQVGNGWYKNLAIHANSLDNQSGVESIETCFTTDTICQPDNLFPGNSISSIFMGGALPQKLCARSTDKVGNHSEVICTDYYKVDNIPPVLVGTASPYKDTITVDVSKSHDGESGISKFYYSKDNGKSWYASNSSGKYTFIGMPKGTYVMNVKVVDYAGNESEGTTTDPVTIE